MHDSSVFDFQSAEKTQIDQQVFGVFRYDSFELFKNIVKDKFGGLFLELCQFGHCADVELDGGVGEIHFVLHLHAVFDQEFFNDADDGFFGIVFGDEVGAELN
jgi:hypothetical protein